MAATQDHRAKAAECIRRSRLAVDEEAKVFFLSMAQLWLALAQEHAKFERQAEDEINTSRIPQ